MRKENFTWAKEALFEEIRRAYRVDKDSPMIITPMILKEMGYQLGETFRKIIFLGFNRKQALLIPKGTIFHEDVWLADCKLAGAHNVTFMKDLYFVNSEVRSRVRADSVESQDKARTGRVKGIRVFDPSSWNSYLEDRRNSRVTENGMCKIIQNTDKVKTLERMFMEVFEQVPKLDLVTYCEKTPNVQTLYNKNAEMYTIEGKIIIHGPYQFNVPESLTLKGELLYLDIVNDGFTKEHQANIVLGNCVPDVQSYFEYETGEY
ncbi:hypothetical protein [Vibrio phage vB_VmeM-Yong XC32]|nr:hypothetical protein [Vibrio phage vB_VmeM-Yong XC31]QAX96417.1 hypothetical protein [Vibrio phage vB_VmeM-Yong XC32]QAX96734.1 hypothetical protein [Vibrio phage vB_VmeM-Yong MS31]QAX97053.1 hypothetical protein [Vibrio phage vB_VmeM-Yong MS32]